MTCEVIIRDNKSFSHHNRVELFELLYVCVCVWRRSNNLDLFTGRITTKRISVDLAQISSADSIYSTFSNQLSSLEHRYNKLTESDTALQSKHQEFLDINQNNLAITRRELEKLQTQIRLFFEWRKVLESEMNNVAKAINIMQQYKIEIDNINRDLQRNMTITSNVQKEQDMQKQLFTNEQEFVRQELQTFNEKLYEFKDFMTQENTTIGGLWNDQNIKCELMQKNVNNLQKFVDEKANSYEKLIFDIRAVTQVSSEASETLEVQERTIQELAKSIKQFKLDFEVLEDNQTRIISTTSPPGNITKNFAYLQTLQ